MQIFKNLDGEIAIANNALYGYENIISVFGGTRIKRDSEVYLQIRQLAKKLAINGYSIMTGGGSGAMEAANSGVYFAKLEKELPNVISVGLNIKLPFEQDFNEYVEIPLEFSHFASRKQIFLEYTQAFIVVDGGFGTLDEVGEILVNIAVGHKKNVPFIFYGDYWLDFIEWIKKRMLRGGLISNDEYNIISIADNVDEVLNLLKHRIIYPIHHK